MRRSRGRKLGIIVTLHRRRAGKARLRSGIDFATSSGDDLSASRSQLTLQYARQQGFGPKLAMKKAIVHPGIHNSCANEVTTNSARKKDTTPYDRLARSLANRRLLFTR